jgi:hypothetical protein
MSDTQDKEVIAAHAYRDGKIFFTVTITTVTEWSYLINREDTGFLLGTTGSLDEAFELADMYLLGITTGYDLGMEHASKGREHTKHERTDADQRTTYGCVCGCGRSASFESERRDRTHDEGSSQGQRPH